MTHRKPLASSEACFGEIEDLRVQGRCQYSLLEIITITICAVIAGSEGWTDVETFGKRGALHRDRACASENGLTLRQRKVNDKSNEITAIPELLELLNVSGCIVTIDRKRFTTSAV